VAKYHLLDLGQIKLSFVVFGDLRMKKSLLALAALSAFATAAQAQSSVTVYGIVDIGYGSKDYTNNNYVAGQNGSTTGAQQSALSSQRLGFRGTEDLGGGLKANFTLESGMTSETAPTFAREYKVGLASSTMGSLDIGLSKTVSQLMMERYTAGGANNWVGEAFNYNDTTTFNTQTIPAYGSTAAIAAVNEAAADQTPVNTYTSARATGFHYNSPVMSGVQVGVTYANSDNKDEDGSLTLGNNAKAQNQEIAIVYTGIKGLSLGASKGERKARAATATASDKKTVTQFGGSYTYGPATVYAQYIESVAKDTAGVQASALEGTQFGVKYAVNSKVTLHAQMAQVDQEGTTAGTRTHDRDAMQLGAQYALSKRTTAYVLYGTQESKAVSTGVTNEIKGTVAGVRHSF
jgi:predicted porin